MTFWKKDEPIQIGSSFYNVDITTGRIDREETPSRLGTVFERNPFLRKLPKETRLNFLEETSGSAGSRTYSRGHELRGPNIGTSVHIVLTGCVLERTQMGQSSTVRFLGAGAMVGSVEVFDDHVPPPMAKCITKTWTLAVPLDRMRALAETNSGLMKAIGSSVVDRMEAAERIYNRHGLKPEQRLCGLLGHLLMHCAVPGKEYDFMVEGPTQTDLADALCLSIGSVEAALTQLRRSKTVVTGYRSYEFPSVRRLLETSELQFPQGSLARTLASI
ncbi:Crp/Fnr family transcriptional regulator [Streptomyces phaeolivaceus]|uniref:Crp/Fnr family transcriptional regulator n=1 Tax=Streptomyces phaeolivaceus TaxID=2653200 RepID=A0A5P8K1I1_9ACTN|nr:Crp/Fnr family transcriptional regulator [Streptomyces phaeolivaceus]QFQ96642.1 Crp/Fnr family transcriptional regulator [Streptomyces phaeolivaceus]